MKKIAVLKTKPFWLSFVFSFILVTLFFNMSSDPDIVLVRAENPRFVGKNISDQTFVLRLRQANVSVVEVFASDKIDTCVGEPRVKFPLSVASAPQAPSSPKPKTIVISGSAVSTENTGTGQNAVSVSSVQEFKVTVPFYNDVDVFVRTKNTKGESSRCVKIFKFSDYLWRAQDQGSEAGLSIATSSNAIGSFAPSQLEGFQKKFPETTVIVRPRFFRRLPEKAKISFFLGETCHQNLGEFSYKTAMEQGAELDLKEASDRNFSLSAKLSYQAEGLFRETHQSSCYLFAQDLNPKTIPPMGELLEDNLTNVILKFPDPGNKVSQIQLRNDCSNPTKSRSVSTSELQHSSRDASLKQLTLQKWEAGIPGRFFYQLVGKNGRIGACGRLVDYSRGTSSEERLRNKIEIKPHFENNKFLGLKVLFPASDSEISIWVKRKDESRFAPKPTVVINPGSGFEWIHRNAQAGIHYEYLLKSSKLFKIVSGGHQIPWEENKGRILIVVEDLLMKFSNNNLRPVLNEYINTLTSEGWQVDVITNKRHLDTLESKNYALNPNQTNTCLRPSCELNEDDLKNNQIKNNRAVEDLKYQIGMMVQKHRSQLKAVLLLGHLPIPFSGTNPIDNHPDHSGSWAADSYYTSFTKWDDGNNLFPNWSQLYRDGYQYPGYVAQVRRENKNYPGDGKFNNDYLPSGTQFLIGRVDFSLLNVGIKNVTKDLFSWYNAELNEQDPRRENFKIAFESYLEQYRRYLRKNIAYRRGELDTGTRVLKSTSSTWPGLADSVLAQSTDITRDSDTTEIISDIDSFKIPELLKSTSALFVHSRGQSHYFKNGGAINDAQALSDEAEFINSKRAVFWGMFGSYFGNTYSYNNIQRSVLSSPTPDPVNDGHWGLASYYTHYPLMHRMTLGGTIGEAIDLGLNAQKLCSGCETFRARVSHTLQGDPTLKMHVVPMPIEVTSLPKSGTSTEIRWRGKQGQVSHYEIYRGQSAGGFRRLIATVKPNESQSDPSGWNWNSWVDNKNFKAGQNNFYWVRPVHVQTSLSGSYINKGLFASPKSPVR